MTESIIYSAQQSEAAIPLCSPDILLNLVVIFLAPIFLSASNGDISLARLAAIETVKSYRAHSHADLLAVAQIVAFGFATLGSLCLSMADDLSLTAVLRLRGNANALSRSAEAHRRRLEQSRANAGQPQPPAHQPAQPSPTAPPATKDATLAARPTPSVPATGPSDAQWAAACAEAAEQIAAEVPHLPPKEQQMAAIQAAALNFCASEMPTDANAQQRRPSQSGDVMSPDRLAEFFDPALQRGPLHEDA